MATEKTDFLRFNAYSMKELITRKLSEDTKFTDQVYEGSNLAILIDIVSYMYQCLIYQLNNAASESMFADTQIYENIQRLCKFLGYNVNGCSPSSFQLQLTNNGTEKLHLPCYSRIDTKKTDRNGKPIYFSTAGTNNTTETMGGDLFLQPGITKTINLYNGEWKLLSTVFEASGVPNETFVLDGIQSDSSKQKYVATNMINVVVKSKGSDEFDVNGWKSDANGIFLNYTNERAIFDTNNTNIYGPQQKVYSISLNDRKTYELKFGNGIVGKTLTKGDLVYVFYLDSNGPDGEMELNDVDFSSLKFEHSREMFNLDQDTYDKMFNIQRTNGTVNTPLVSESSEDLSPLAVQQTTSKFIPEQTVDEIRENAPQWFKMGNRLVTPHDYEYFIKNIVYVRDYIPGIQAVDVKCMNNNQYMSTFLKWLYLNGRDHHGDGRYYFRNQRFWNTTQYTLVDPADANNTYIWIKSSNSGQVEDEYDVSKVEEFMNEKLNPVKTMTTEIKVLKPVLVDFDICAYTDVDGLKAEFTDPYGGGLLPGTGSYVEITMDDERLFTGNQIQNQVAKIILDYFDKDRCRLGQIVSFDGILRDIYGISGVQQVNTVYVDPVTKEYKRLNGLSFVSWSPILQPEDGSSDGYDDIVVSTTARKLEQFQFPVFVGGSMADRVKLISKNTSKVNQVEQ